MSSKLDLVFLLGGNLDAYKEFFLATGYDDAEAMISWDSKELEDMIEVVADAAKKKGVDMLVGHKRRIIKKIEREKVKREKVQQSRDRADENGSARDLEKGQGRKKNRPGNEPAENKSLVTSSSTREIPAPLVDTNPLSLQMQLLLSGLSCFGKKWWCCAGFGVATLIGSFILYGMYYYIKPDYMRAGPGDEGAWQFTKVLYICGFTVSCIAFLICFATVPITAVGSTRSRFLPYQFTPACPRPNLKAAPFFS